jgi:hypothetical protein
LAWDDHAPSGIDEFGCITPKLFGVESPDDSCYDPATQDIAAIHGRDAMKPPQFSIAKLMIVVGIVALNITAPQFWSHSSEPSALSGRFLTFIALQVGLFFLIRSRRTWLFPFWAGFEVFGLVAAFVSIYIDFFSPEGSVLFGWMDTYYFNSYKFLEKISILIRDPYYRSRIWTNVVSHDGGVIDNSLWEVVSFLPHLAIAVVGGFLTSLAIRCLGNRRGPTALESATAELASQPA